MKTRTTLILLALSLAAGIWVWRDLNRKADPELHYGALVKDWTIDVVTRIQIERDDTNSEGKPERIKIVFEKKDGQWWMVEPQREPAEPQRITQMLENPGSSWSP